MMKQQQQQQNRQVKILISLDSHGPICMVLKTAHRSTRTLREMFRTTLQTEIRVQIAQFKIAIQFKIRMGAIRLILL
jgi:hypothetical protein